MSVRDVVKMEKNCDTVDAKKYVPPFDYRKAALKRLGVIVGLVLFVSVVVYFTPMPGEFCFFDFLFVDVT